MKVNKITIYHALTWLLFLLFAFTACGTKKNVVDKDKTKTEVKKEEVKTEIKDSTSVKKETETTKTETKTDIKKENNTTEEIIEYFPKKDSAGNQLIKSKTKRDINLKEVDQSVGINEMVRSALDSLNKKYALDLSLKIDSLNQAVEIVKTKEADTTVANNIPSWVWVVGLIGLLFFLALKFK